jgi:hypothetical protein
MDDPRIGGAQGQADERDRDRAPVMNSGAERHLTAGPARPQDRADARRRAGQFPVGGGDRPQPGAAALGRPAPPDLGAA